MLTINIIRDNPEEVVRRLAVKNFNARELVSEILELDKSRRQLKNNLDNRQADVNSTSKKIGELMQQKKKEEAEAAKNHTASLKEEIKEISVQLDGAEHKLDNLLVKLPNLPSGKVPAGRGADDNVIVRSGGTIPNLPENAKPHWELAKILDIIDFDLGSKLTGAGFPVYKGAGAKLQRALISFFLDENINAGDTEIMPPLMVNEDSGYGTGQLPDKDSQMYHVGLDNLYLIPTAEVPVTNIYRDVILDISDFPVKNTAYTPCFR